MGSGASGEKLTNKSRFNVLQQEKFTYANRFLERHRTVGYFEVKVLLGGFYDQIAIGVTSNSSFPLGEFAGYQAHSVAYHADDGKCYMEGTSFAYSSRYGSGDTIGCGVTADKNIYFTINGILLPVISCQATFIQDTQIFPIVSIRGKLTTF